MIPAPKKTFSKKSRLKKSSHIQHVLKKGTKERYGWLTLSYVERDICGDGKRPISIGSNRLGIVVGKKIIAQATERNLFKRIVREFFRTHQNRLPYPYDYVVCARKAPEKRTSAFYWQTLLSLFKHGKLL